MAFFGFGKKKEKKSCCCCDTDNSKVTEEKVCCAQKTDGVCCIKVLGSGCKACHTLYEHAKQAAEESGIHADVVYVTDMEQIMAYGVMSTPALVVNDRVVSMGKVLKAEEVKRYLV